MVSYHSRLTTTILGFAFLFMDAANAYSTDSSPFAPSVLKIKQHRKTTLSPSIGEQGNTLQQTFVPKSKRYDLGLHEEQSSLAAAQHWQPSESTRIYPNPAFVAVAHRPAKQQRQIPVVQPRRHNTDHFEISSASGDSDTLHPTMIAKDPLQQFELNTPWIEFLIHEQQVKHGIVQA